MNRTLAALIIAAITALVPIGLLSQTQTNLVRVGGQPVVPALCDDYNQFQNVPINVSASGMTQIVSATAGQRIYPCAYDFIATGTVNLTFREGTGTNCGTGTNSLSGVYSLTAQDGLVRGNGGFAQWKTGIGQAFCINLDAAVAVGGIFTYAKK